MFILCLLCGGMGYCTDLIAQRQEAASQFLVVRGFFDSENRIFVYPLYFTEEKRFGSPDGKGPYTADFQDSAGRTLASYAFGTGLLTVILKDKPEKQVDSHSFAFEIPCGEDVQNVVIRRGSQILWRKERSRSGPTVSFVRPNEGESVQGQVAVEWEASDRDGETVYCLPEYREERGLPWQPLSGFLTENRLTVDTTRLPSGRDALFGIRCTDGFNTTRSTVRVKIINPLTIEYTTPAGGEAGVSRLVTLYVKFRSDLKASTLNEGTFTVLEKGIHEVPGRISYRRNARTAVFIPENTLKPLTEYTARISADVEDVAGNKLRIDYEWTFTTGPQPD